MLGHQVRAGFRESATKAMSANTAGGIQSPHGGRDRATTSGPAPLQFHFQSPYKDFPFYTPPRRREVMPPKEVVRIEDDADRWRFLCPRGHRTWEPTNHHFWCQLCARRDDADGVFYELRDQKTDALLKRDRVQLLTDSGPYDRELDGGAR